jgi:CDP-4-dehydro-6-deoxyglucose reductase
MPHVRLLPDGRLFEAGTDESVLEAALRAGLNLPHSCKGGHCTSCRATIVSGEVTYPGAWPAGLTTAEARAGQALLCQARARTDLVVEAREVRPAAEIEIRSLPCRVVRLARLADDVMALTLRLPRVEEFPYRAGQYLDVMLAGGRRRSFSIASAPADGRDVELHVRRASGGEFTGQVFGGMAPGTLLRIEGPLGQFWFRQESARPALMIGGGTGYAPLRSMLRELMAEGDARPLALYWGARSMQGLYEHDWLRETQAKRPGFIYRPVLSDPGLEPPEGVAIGLVHDAVVADIPDLSRFDVYASGPPQMIEAIRSTFPRHGLPLDRLFFDSFDYAPDTLTHMR